MFGKSTSLSTARAPMRRAKLRTDRSSSSLRSASSSGSACTGHRPITGCAAKNAGGEASRCIGKRPGDAAERAEAGPRPVGYRGGGPAFAPYDDDPVALGPQRRDGMIEERRAAQERLRLVGAEAARLPAGEYRAEQLHAIMPCASQMIRALSARASETSVNPADAARSAARLVGAEMVTSIGQPARTVFSTSS